MRASTIELNKRRRAISLYSVPGRAVPSLTLFLLQIGLLMSIVASARADFSGPYDPTPPAPGIYDQSPMLPRGFGGWTLWATAGGIILDTSLAPASLALNVSTPASGHAGFLFTRAADSGTVSFQYSITGENVGRFEWFNNGPQNPTASPPSTFMGTNSNPIVAPTTTSFEVQAGDYFGFHLSAIGNLFPTIVGSRTVTIDNLVAPVPEPSTVTLMVTGAMLLVWRVWRRSK